MKYFKSIIFRMHAIFVLFRLLRPPYENKIHATGTGQVRETATVCDYTKVSCDQKVAEPRIRILCAFEIFCINSCSSLLANDPLKAKSRIFFTSCSILQALLNVLHEQVGNIKVDTHFHWHVLFFIQRQALHRPCFGANNCKTVKSIGNPNNIYYQGVRKSAG